MLHELNIKNFAIIEDMRVSFTKGLNVLTGETGSGKSIIIDALGLLLGKRASKSIIKNGEDLAYIEGVFTTKNMETLSMLEESGVEVEENQIIITREIYLERPGVSRINGKTVTTGMLSKISQGLIDIFAQEERQYLFDRKNQRILLDSLLGREHLQNLKKLEEVYRELLVAKEEYENLKNSESGMKREVDMLKFQIEEIDAAALKDEDENLEDELRRAINVSGILENLNEAQNILSSSYEGISVEDGIDRIITNVYSILKYDNALETLLNDLEDIRYKLRDISSELSSYGSSLEVDEEHLYYLNQRVDTINTLKKKYGSTQEKIREFYNQASSRLELLEDFENALINMENRIKTLEDSAMEIARTISNNRIKYARELEVKMEAELQELNMTHAGFKIEISEKNLSQDGIDSIEFLISTNLGEGFKPMASTASGGEMSRIMLGFKSIIAKNDSIETMIFDEIDAGISGKTADIVGKKIQKLSEENQIIAISHLPQIVSKSYSHYLIEKEVVDGGTTSSVRRLNDDERVLELARLIGGLEISEHTIAAARELLGGNNVH